MWGKKDEPESPTAAAPAPTPPAPAAPRPVPPRPVAPSPPVASSVPAPMTPSSGQAYVGKSLQLKGEISGSEDLLIDGLVEGTVELKDNNLTIGPNGNVQADVQARSITVVGRLRGNVRAVDRVEIRKTGSLEGDLATARIIIEDGAVFRGSIDIVQPGRQEADHKVSAPAPQRETAGAASAGNSGSTSTSTAKS